MEDLRQTYFQSITKSFVRMTKKQLQFLTEIKSFPYATLEF